MDRRNSLKTIMAASGALIALPAWAGGWSVNDLKIETSLFSQTEQDLLSHVADTIIPAGNSIGALTVGVDKFLTKLFANCYETEVQENIKKQLEALDASAQQTHGKAFASCGQIQRQDLLLKFSVSENKNEKDFFDLIKSETIRGFSTSKEVMLGYLDYKVVPGHYYGCVDVTA